ncbi:MAG: hypothetical protein U0W24_08205 [Bacteroidales bacterium]
MLLNIFKKQGQLNLFTYLVFILIALVGMVFGKFISQNYSSLRIWEITDLLVLLAGIPFLFFMSKAGIPDFWQPEITNRYRFLIPALLGCVFGILDIFVFKILLHPEAYKELPPFLQPFPYSVFLYFSGAFEIEIFYRLIPLTLILLLGIWFKKGKYSTVFFVVGAIITSLREPLEQMPETGTLIIIYSLVTGFAMNYIQAIWFKRAGFLSALSVRLGHYLFWHILLGIYVQFIEL